MCRTSNPLQKSQENWFLRGSFTASSCSGDAEWETQVQHCQSPALRALLPVKECGGKSPSTVAQTPHLQPAFLQLLGEKCGDPGVAVIFVGRMLFTRCMKKILFWWESLENSWNPRGFKSPWLSSHAFPLKNVVGTSAICEDKVLFSLIRHFHFFQPDFPYLIRFSTVCL